MNLADSRPASRQWHNRQSWTVNSSIEKTTSIAQLLHQEPIQSTTTHIIRCQHHSLKECNVDTINSCEPFYSAGMPSFGLSVLPLNVRKKKSSCATNSEAIFTTTNDHSTTRQFHMGEMTPPLTPAVSNEDFSPVTIPQSLHFFDYLRAAYPFHPSSDLDPSTVTLPLNQGDIVLVHSIHSNGWADGTLLDSGRRGWLPTNYCEPFDPEQLRNLLKGTTTLWDAVKDCCDGLSTLINVQDLMRGVIAGVRYLLVCVSLILLKR